MNYLDLEHYEQWPANHKNDKQPSKKIIKLGRKITDVAGHIIGGVKVEDPEYWGLAEIITEEMADVGQFEDVKNIRYRILPRNVLSHSPEPGQL